MRRAAFLAATTLLLLAACSGGDDNAESTTSNDAATESIPSDAMPSGSTSSDDAGTEVRLTQIAMIRGAVDVAGRKGDAAIYVVSRDGTVIRLTDDTETVALDVTDLTSTESERGLLGLAFSPDGLRAYVNYTDARGDTVIAALDVAADGSLLRNSQRILFTVAQPYSNHNGGDLVVAADGAIYVATGDGGSGGDPDRVALDDASLLGKVVRIDPRNGAASLVARGLRNPWRIDLHDDDLWMADVGQNAIEEVNVLRNVSAVTEIVSFGWSAFEGPERYNDDQPRSGHESPLAWYEHGDDGCSISGGAVAVSGSLSGRYAFGDYCSGRIWSIPADGTSSERSRHFDSVDQLSAVARAHEHLYVLSLGGDVFRIEN